MKTLVSIDRPADRGPGFNQAAADVVYKAMTAMDEETALVYGRMLVAGAVNYDLISHRDELAKYAGDQAERRTAVLRTQYSRQAVAKARRGEDNTEEIAVLVQIEKAFNLTTEQRRKNAAGRTRHEGRFVREQTKIETDPSRPPTDTDRAKKGGVPPAPKLQGNDLAHYQQAYGQISDMLAPFQREEYDPRLHLRVANRAGQERSFVVPVEPAKSKKSTDFSDKLESGDRIVSAQVSTLATLNQADTAVFDALAAAGAPRLGGYAGYAIAEGALNPEKVKQFNQGRTNRPEGEQLGTGARAFGRLERGSEILRESLGPVAPPKLQYALAVANHVGQYGPEAQKVIGPVADRAAYRYRGTERSPDPALQAAFGKVRQYRFKGVNPRDVAVGGIEDPKEGWDPGPVLNYWQDRLPNPDLNELQRRSGVIPPSEGIVIRADGQVAHQSVGYADDWYLPFNLRHLSALKGGEYIRTRTFGGPTTEDIYTGLVSGAKSMTIVSHNGVYTVDFDRNLRGGRRFNDKAGRMVARYGQLLDALRSEQVSRGSVSPSRMEELRVEARRIDPDELSDGFQRRMQELQAQERHRPTLSEQEKVEAAANWLGDQAANTLDSNGNSMSSQEYVDRLVNARAKIDWQANAATARQMGVDPAFREEVFREPVRAALQAGTPLEQITRVAELAGQRSSFDRAMKTADQANQDRVRSLRLDGAGYADALNALHEQFPYYIAKPVYHPWRSSQGVGPDRTLERTTDTGYVAPRFLRPQKAEAGYFNDRVTGQGKVEAQSTRNQNFRVGGGKLVPVKSPVQDAGVRSTERYKGNVSSGVGDDDLQRAADLAMLDDLLTQTTFQSGAELDNKGSPIDVGGLNIKDEVKQKSFPHPAIKRVFLASRQELEALPQDEFHRLMLDIADVATGPKKVFSLKEVIVQQVRNGGKIEPPKPLPASLGEMLRGSDKDYAFPGAAYDPARTPDLGAIEQAYKDDSLIKELTDAGDLPQVDLPADDKTFDTAADNLKSRLEKANTAYVQRRSVGGQVDSAAMRNDMRTAEGLLRAKQLRRRWLDADRVRPAAPTPPGPAHVNQLFVAQAPGGGITPLTPTQLAGMGFFPPPPATNP